MDGHVVSALSALGFFIASGVGGVRSSPGSTRPIFELARKRPIDLILAGRAQMVADLLEATLAGVPT
jgi:hypothetical protein